MELMIYRVRMAGLAPEAGLTAHSYEVYVPADALEREHGVDRKDLPRHYTLYQVAGRWRSFVTYEVATFKSAHPPGLKRWEAMKAHLPRAEAAKLRILKKACPEARGLHRWPKLWAYVPPPPDGDVCRMIRIGETGGKQTESEAA